MCVTVVVVLLYMPARTITMNYKPTIDEHRLVMRRRGQYMRLGKRIHQSLGVRFLRRGSRTPSTKDVRKFSPRPQRAEFAKRHMIAEIDDLEAILRWQVIHQTTRCLVHLESNRENTVRTVIFKPAQTEDEDGW